MSARVVARWAGRARYPGELACDECGQCVPAGEDSCPGCYQATASRVGTLAVIVDTPTGERLVIAERSEPGGGWVPIRAVPATGEAVRMVRRQHSLPAPAVGGVFL